MRQRDTAVAGQGGAARGDGPSWRGSPTPSSRPRHRAGHLRQSEWTLLSPDGAVLGQADFHPGAAALHRSDAGEAVEELGIGRPSSYASILLDTVVSAAATSARTRTASSPRARGGWWTAFLINYIPRILRLRFHRRSGKPALRGEARGAPPTRMLLEVFWRDFSLRCRKPPICAFTEVLAKRSTRFFSPFFWFFVSFHGAATCSRRAPTARTRGFAPTVASGGCRCARHVRAGRSSAVNYPECPLYTRPYRPTEPGCLRMPAIGRRRARAGRRSRHVSEPVDAARRPLRALYVQLGEGRRGGAEPSALAAPRAGQCATSTLAKALQLLELPRLVGRP